MQVPRGITPMVTGLAQRPVQSKSTGPADAPLATAMRDASSRFPALARLHPNVRAEGPQASPAERPRASLKVFARGVGLGLAAASLGAVLAGCGSSPSGPTAGSPGPINSPQSTGQTIDPAPTDSSTASTSTAYPTTAYPSTPASSPTGLTSIMGQGNPTVALVKMQLDADCGLEARAIANQPKPTSETLGQLYDRIHSVAQKLDADGRTADPDALHKLLDAYLVAEEDEISAGNRLSESTVVQLIRRQRMDDDVQYWQAQYQQDRTQHDSEELSTAQDAENQAATDGLIISSN